MSQFPTREESRRSSSSILVVEDDPTTSEVICIVLKDHGLEPKPCFSAGEAIHFLRENIDVSALLIDLSLPDGDGIAVMREARKIHQHIPCIILTAKDSVDAAVLAMKAGAENYLIKPFEPDSLVNGLKTSIETYHSLHGGGHHQETYAIQAIRSWKSPVMRQAMEIAMQAAKTLSPVLLTGERGNGKGSIAQFIHQNGKLDSRPFLTINPALMSPMQVELELFGRTLSQSTENNAFARGKLDRSRGSTLYIENVDALTLASQKELLQWVHADQKNINLGQPPTRLITSSSVDLTKAISEGKFLQNLWYALAVYHVEVPRLAERSEDLPQLCEGIITRICVSRKIRRPNLTRQATEMIQDHTWPGNLSELYSVLEHAVTRTCDGLIGPEDFPPLQKTGDTIGLQRMPIGAASIDDVTRLNLIATLEACGGNRRRAAQRLKISLRTIYNMIQRYELAPKVKS